MLDKWSLCFEPELWPSRDTGTDIENKHMDTKGEGRWDGLGDWEGHTDTIDTMYKLANY